MAAHRAGGLRVGMHPEASRSQVWQPIGKDEVGAHEVEAHGAYALVSPSISDYLGIDRHQGSILKETRLDLDLGGVALPVGLEDLLLAGHNLDWPARLS